MFEFVAVSEGASQEAVQSSMPFILYPCKMCFVPFLFDRHIVTGVDYEHVEEFLILIPLWKRGS
jgi:hypothetical protein